MKIPIFFKSMMTAILFFLIPWEGKATGLSGDVIYLQGEEWVLLDKPINRDSILFHRLMEFLPDNHCITTANWEGYTAYWEVQQSHVMKEVKNYVSLIAPEKAVICICIIWKSVSMINRRKKSIPSLISQTN